MDDDFYNEDPKRYGILSRTLAKFRLELTPGGSLEEVEEAYGFLRELWSQYDGPDNAEARVAWLEEQIPKYYRSLDKPPEWIQSPQWPFAGGKPMIFVGQVDVEVRQGELASKLFHDDVSYYVFMPSYDLIGSNAWHPDRTIAQQW